MKVIRTRDLTDEAFARMFGPCEHRRSYRTQSFSTVCANCGLEVEDIDLGWNRGAGDFVSLGRWRSFTTGTH